MKKSLSIEPMFPDIPLVERLQYAAKLGFEGIEIFECAKDNAKEIGNKARELNLEVTGCLAKGVFNGHLNQSYDKVKGIFLESLRYMKDLGCKRLIILPGRSHRNIDTQKCLIIENLKKLVILAQDNDVTILLEPANSLENHIGHYLDNSQTAAEIIRCVDHKNLRMTYDLYHMQIMEGNIIQTIRSNIDIIEHFHSAGVPGRNEHHLGELNYPNIIKVIKDLGYTGFFGLEYFPTYNCKQSIEDVLAYLNI